MYLGKKYIFYIFNLPGNSAHSVYATGRVKVRFGRCALSVTLSLIMLSPDITNKVGKHQV